MKLRDPAFRALPEPLQRQARPLFEDAAWPAAAAIEVVDACAAAGLAVVAMERWTVVERLPRWLGASDYDLEPGGDWPAYVTACAEAARTYLAAAAASAELFQVTVLGVGEAGATAGDRSVGGGQWAWLRRLFGR